MFIALQLHEKYVQIRHRLYSTIFWGCQLHHVVQVYLNYLRRLSAADGFIEFCRCENFTTWEYTVVIIKMVHRNSFLKCSR